MLKKGPQVKFRAVSQHLVYSKSLIGSIKSTCSWHFIFQFHMVAQLGSLIGVVVLFMMETMDQVSLKMELSWTFNSSFQNSRKLSLSLIDLDILTCRVLPILWNNSSWGKYKSWSWCVGGRACMKMALVGINFAPQFWSLPFFVNTLTMLPWHIIIS
jgi:hypothetical protein